MKKKPLQVSSEGGHIGRAASQRACVGGCRKSFVSRGVARDGSQASGALWTGIWVLERARAISLLDGRACESCRSCDVEAAGHNVR